MTVVGHLVAANARRTPEKMAYTYENESITWGEFEDLTNRVGNAFLMLARQARFQHAAVLADNCLETVIAIFGAAKAGVPLVLLKPAFRPGELARLIDHGHVGVLAVEDRYRHTVEEALSLLGAGGRGRLLRTIGDRSGRPSQLMACAAEQPAKEPAGPMNDSVPFVIAYTSGTTGDPKGAIVTHRNAVAGAFNSVVESRVLPHHRALMWNPLFTMGGLGVLLVPTARGCSTWVLDYRAQNDPVDGPPILFGAIDANQINFLMGGPIFFFGDERADGYDLSTLETVVNGNASVGRAGRLFAALRRLGEDRVMNLYGMTESSGSMITVLQKEDLRVDGEEQEQRRALSVGQAAIGVDLRLVDENLVDVSPGSDAIGEVWVRGEAIIGGYWQNSEADRETFLDGWMRTGDLARRDESGAVFLVDRSKDVIRSGSSNIYSFEVETVLSEHVAVAEVAVIGVPHEFYGETPKAIVRLRDGHRATSAELIGFVSERIASYKKPTSVEFVQSFPRNSSGKILKRSLREQYRQATHDEAARMIPHCP